MYARTAHKSTAPRPRRVSATHYKVDSSTNTLVAYDVRQGEHGWECNCTGFGYRRRCHHVSTVMAHLNERERVAPVGLMLEDLFA